MVALGFDDFDCGGVDGVGGDAWFDRVFCGGFGFEDSGVHFDDFVGDVVVDDAAGAVAVVVGGFDVGKEFDDDGLSCKQRALSSFVAVGSGWASGDDGAVGRGGVVFEEPDVDEAEHAFTGEGFVVEEELTCFVGGCIGDGFTGHFHAAFGDGLGVAEVVEFFGVFRTAIHDAEVWIAVDGDACFGDVVAVDRGEGAVDGDGFDSFLKETLSDGLGGFEFAVAGLPVFGFEVFWADDLVGAGGFFGAFDFDVSDHEEAVGLTFGWENDQGGGVAYSEADLVVEREVGHGGAGEDDGVVLFVISHGEP